MPGRPALPPDIKELMGLVRAGRLFDVQAWIKAGKRTMPPEPYWFSPLRIAVDKGFHSMVQVLLEAGVDQEEKDYMLHRAVGRRNLDLIRLTIDQGADVHSIPFDEVCSTGNPELVRLFIDLGVDPTFSNGFATALMRPNRPMLGIYKAYQEKIPGLRHQINLALRFHAEKGGLQWVCLLLWAGADGHVPLPEIDEEPDPETFSTALEEAVSRGHEKIVEKIGIDPKRDNLQKLLREACSSGDQKIMAKVLAAGAKADIEGDYSPMNALIWRLEMAIHPLIGNYSSFKVDDALKNIEFLAQRGARWKPDSLGINGLRRDLYRLDPIWIRKIFRSFETNLVCTPEIIASLLKSPKMKAIFKTAEAGKRTKRIA